MTSAGHSAVSEPEKKHVADFWESASCGEAYASGGDAKTYYQTHFRTRYKLEPFIADFARFDEARDKRVLEIGVGMGADHLRWKQMDPALLVGVDLTARAMGHTRARFAVEELPSVLLQGDAERLPVRSENFDFVYSWGVIHHSPRTELAVKEIHRVLKSGGLARVMVYQRPSLVGLMLWARYGLFQGKPTRTMRDIYAHHLESPGTKGYTLREANQLFSDFRDVKTSVALSPADLLTGVAGQRHNGSLLRMARMLWPRPLVERAFASYGLFLMIEARK